MPYPPQESLRERGARASTRCPGCLASKSIGELVCWDCWKGRNGRPALKHYTGDLAQWLEDYPPGSAVLPYGLRLPD